MNRQLRGICRELAELVDQCRVHPSIVCWVPFNEGWGQYDTRSVTAWLYAVDPSRLVNSASGGCDPPPTGGSAGVGDFYDIHQYPWPTGLQDAPLDVAHLETERVTVVGEWGGLGFAAPAAHSWDVAAAEQGWGYATYKVSTARSTVTINFRYPLIQPLGWVHRLRRKPRRSWSSGRTRFCSRWRTHGSLARYGRRPQTSKRRSTGF